MYFQNQNTRKEPSLKVLSLHINVTTHFTSISLTEIMMNEDAYELIKMQGRRRVLGFTSKCFKP